jgi:hypothetical protein
MVPFYARAIHTLQKASADSGTAVVTAIAFMGELVSYVRFRCVAIDLQLNELAERIWWAHQQIVSRPRAQTERDVQFAGGGTYRHASA